MATRKYVVGYTQTNRQGLTYTVVEYRNRNDINVQFEDGLIIEHVPVTRLNQNTLMHPDYPIPKKNKTPTSQRLGETRENTQGSKMTIIAYRETKDIDVQFENGFVVDHTQYHLFERGTILDPFSPTLYGVGYMGMRTDYGDSKKYSKQHEVWSSMMKRCYNENCARHPWYEECTVAEEWHNFSNFLKWYDDHYYELPEGMGRIELDKDFKVKECRVYSPDTCLLIPQRINGAKPKTRTTDREFPIGMTYQANRHKYRVRINQDGKDTVIGYYDTVEDAFSVLKREKEKELRRLADLYKPYIPDEVYQAVINYEISITD